MSNEEFQKLVLEQLGDLKQSPTELRQNQARMEFEILEKISAVVDGQKVTDDKLDDFIISTNANLNFLVNSLAYKCLSGRILATVPFKYWC